MSDALTGPSMQLPILQKRRNGEPTTDSHDLDADGDAVPLTTPSGDVLVAEAAPLLHALEQRIEIAFTRFHQGPLPAPDQFEAYEQTLTGAADRILKMAEDNLAHKHRMAEVKLRGQIQIAKRGQTMALVAVLTVMGIGAWLVLAGHDVVGGIVMGVDVGGIAGVFIYGRYRKAKRAEADEAVGDQPVGPMGEAAS